MFLLPSPPRLSKRHRLEHILLLILRCIALALLALGFARPFMRQAPIDDPTAAQPKRMVILVDTSASMRRDGLWAAARTRVEDVLRRAGPADQVALYPFDRQATALVSFEDWNRTAPGDRVAFAMGRLGGVQPTWAGTHVGNALVTAAEALAETEGKTAAGPRQIVLVSDLQAGSRLEALQAYEWPKEVELVVEAIKARTPTNAGIQLVAESQDSSRAIDAPVRVRVTNATDSKREQFKLGWTRPAAAATTASSTPAPDFIGPAIDAYVPPGQSRVFPIPVPKDTTGLEQISLRGDDEAFDNVVYVIPPAQQKATVLWLGADSPDDTKQPLFFLRRAFSDTPRIAVQVNPRSPGTPLSAEDAAAAHLIFVSDPVSAETAAALRTQAQEGKTIMVVPKTAAISPTLGVLLGCDSVPLQEIRANSYAMFTDIDFQHPLFAPFADPRFSDFTKIHIWKYRKLDATALPGARVVMKFDTGDPALVEVPVGKGKIYVLTSGWQPDDSQIAVSTKFVPLVWSLLELSGGIQALATQFSVGDRVPLPAGGVATSVRTPAGTTAALEAKAPEFAQTAAPGVYEASGGPRPMRFAVNVDPNESRTTPLGPDELEQLGVRMAKGQTAPVKEVDNKTFLQGVEAENRQKLWRWCIVATLVILLLETALAGWTARRSALQSEEVAP